jgi:lycopene cyclase domain-containing protein
VTYLGFHLVFIVPPLLWLARGGGLAPPELGPRARWTLPAVTVLALVYTTPWDNYLVYRGVWSYGADRVIGTIGYVPIEEYLFFVLQPLLTGAWTYRVLVRRGFGRMDSVPAPSGVAGRPGARGAALYLLLAAAGGWALTHPRGVYLGLILVWAAPVLAAQWLFVAPAVRRDWRTFLLAVGVPTLYLWAADRVALALGIWSISPAHTTGIHLLGLPVEEAVFFLVTNLLVVQGALLFLRPGWVPALAARR